MKELSGQYDLALIPVTGYKEYPHAKVVSPKPVRPAEQARTELAAAKVLFRKGIVGRFVISGRKALKEEQPVSTVTALEFIRKTHVNPDDITVHDDRPVTTRQELLALKETAGKNNCNNLLILAWELHKPRIETLAKDIFRPNFFQRFVNKISGKTPQQPRVTVVSVEEILFDYGDKRYQPVIERMHQSPKQKKWREYERKVMPMMKIPFVPFLLDSIARIYRPKAD